MQSMKSNSSHHILHNLHNGIELTLSNNKRELTRDHLLVRSVGEILQNGLKEPKNGFWFIIRDITHSTTRATIARALRHVYDNYDRGLFWIYFTLVEGSLESYMNVLVNEVRTLKKFYWEESILRDPVTSEIFLRSLSSLSDVILTPVDSFFERGLKLDLGESLESSKRSLSSPEDSGIALLDSDASSLSDKTEDNPELDLRNDWLNSKIYSISSLNNLKFETLINSRKESFEDCDLSGVGTDSVVIRRKKKKEEVKRVSFHEDVEEKEMRKSARERSPKERYSLPEDFNYKSFLVELFTPASIQMEEKGSEALELNAEERGAPEGQEDPAEFNKVYSEAPLDPVGFKARKPGKELREMVLKKSLTVEMKHAVSKTLLVNNYLNSLPDSSTKAPKQSLYLGPKPIIPSLNKETEEALRCELMKREPTPSGEQILLDGLRDVLCCDIYKVFKMSNLEGESLLSVVTKSKVFLVGALGSFTGIKKTIELQELDTVICGPKTEILFLIMKNKAFTVLVPWFGNGNDFCSALHMASLSRKMCSINFVSLSLSQMESLSRSIREIVGVKETLLDYFWVRGEETVTETSRTKEDHLMVSVRRPLKWIPAQVTLKGCSLSIQREGYEAMHYNMKMCTSCNRLATKRPHTFLLKFKKNLSIVIAAPDDYQMSEWMQAVLTASLKGRESPTGPSNNKVENYGLVVTDNYLIKTKFPDTFIKCTKLTDISSIRVRSAHCIVELDCHEVRETNGDWILYFSSPERRQEFLSRLIEVHPSLEKVIASLSSDFSPYDVKEKQILASFANLVLSYS